MNRVDSSNCDNQSVINSNSYANCKTCNECLISVNHDDCVVSYLNQSKVPKEKVIWRETGYKFTNVGHQWKPTGRNFNVGNSGKLTRPSLRGIRYVKKWRPTGRIFPIESKCPNLRSNTSICAVSTVNSTSSISPVFAGTNQMDPNCTWGSTFFSYPPLSGFKCRSYKSSYGIWTQAVLNI